MTTLSLIFGISLLIISRSDKAGIVNPESSQEPTQSPPGTARGYPVIDTDVDDYYDDVGRISAPSSGEAFYGQDAHYRTIACSYRDNGDGTVTDLNTGLMWQQAAIDPVFQVSSIVNEASQADYPCFWSGTIHVNAMGGGQNAAYVSFGRAMGYMNGQWMDVHGAGAQRSDPKSGDPSMYSYGQGPQGDAVRINNYVRCVRTAN